jgi:succinoglycan biosynthesis protein ExoM
MKLAICIITYRREKGLARLLSSIAELIVPDGLEEIAAFVIDNDARESARETVAEFQKNFPIDLVYGNEARRGIAFARNRALSLAKGYDLVAFVDDDETVSREWLRELVQTQMAGNFDLVTGPLRPVYEMDPPAWLKKMNYFEKKGYRLGNKVKATGSGNMLIRVRALQKEEVFLPVFNLMGGSDGYFVSDLFKKGAGIGWAEKAIAFDWIPASRMKVGWYLQRRFRFGVSNTLAARIFSEPYWFFKRVFIGGGRILFGLAQMPLFFFRGKPLFFKGVGNVCYGAGNFWALLGKTYPEYSKRKAP